MPTLDDLARQLERRDHSVSDLVRAVFDPQTAIGNFRFEQLQSARDSLIDFAQVVNPAFRANWHHSLIASHLEQVASGDIKRLLVLCPPRHGKALKLDTPIPTPNGWKRIDELRPGDQVFGADGRPVSVTAVSPIWRNRPVCKVVTDDGDELIADERHEWLVRLDRKQGAWTVRETGFLADRTSPRNPKIRSPGALQTPDLELPIDPYVLGLWLGDGHSHGGAITMSNADWYAVEPRIQAAGFRTRTIEERVYHRVFGLQQLLRENGLLHNKHVPEVYLWASNAQRLALLQGLIDSDGGVRPDGQINFSNTRECLVDAVRHLVWSLGVKASKHQYTAYLYGKDCGPYWETSFYMADAAFLPRKRQYCRDATRRAGRYLTVSRLPERADTICIEVDAPDHLFLAGRSMIPTHNSLLCSQLFPAWLLGNYDEAVIGAAYNRVKAAEEAQHVKAIFDDPAYRAIFPLSQIPQRTNDVRGEIRRAGHFNLIGRPKAIYRAASIGTTGSGGGLTGYDKTVGLIDDPVKSLADAYSSVLRENVWSWYSSVYRARDTNLIAGDRGVRDVLIMTPWHEDDLAGRILEQEADEWHVLRLPAFLTDASFADKDRDDTRLVDEALWPAMWPKEALLKFQQTHPTTFQALFQCRPSAAGGTLFNRGQFGTYGPHDLPRDGFFQLSVDANFGTENETSSYVSVQLWCFTQGNKAFLVRAWRGHWSFPVTIAQIEAILAQYKQVDEILVEEKANGAAIIQTLRQRVRFAIKGIRPTDSKMVRAIAVAPWIESGAVLVPREPSPWLEDWLSEICAFPRGKNNDQVDAMSQALLRLRDNPTAALSQWAAIMGIR